MFVSITGTLLVLSFIFKYEFSNELSSLANKIPAVEIKSSCIRLARVCHHRVAVRIILHAEIPSYFLRRPLFYEIIIPNPQP